MLNARLMNPGLLMLAWGVLLLMPGTSSAQPAYPGQLLPPGYVLDFGPYPLYFANPHPENGNWYWPNVHWPSRDYYFTYGPPQNKEFRVIPPKPPADVEQFRTAPERMMPPAETAALLEMRVPTPETEIWLGGARTAQRGIVRAFVSPPLVRGERYIYEVHAKWIENGQEVTQIRPVAVCAGERVTVDFTAPATNSRPVGG